MVDVVGMLVEVSLCGYIFRSLGFVWNALWIWIGMVRLWVIMKVRYKRIFGREFRIVFLYGNDMI